MHGICWGNLIGQSTPRFFDEKYSGGGCYLNASAFLCETIHAEILATLWDGDVPHYAWFVPPPVAAGRVFVASSAPGTRDAKAVIALGL